MVEFRFLRLPTVHAVQKRAPDGIARKAHIATSSPPKKIEVRQRGHRHNSTVNQPPISTAYRSEAEDDATDVVVDDDDPEPDIIFLRC